MKSNGVARTRIPFDVKLNDQNKKTKFSGGK
jgi:hypothetical protein